MIGCPCSSDFFPWIQCMRWPGPYDPQERFRGIQTPEFRASEKGRALARHRSVSAASSSEPPASVGVGVPSSRSLTTATREATQFYVLTPLSGLNCSDAQRERAKSPSSTEISSLVITGDVCNCGQIVGTGGAVGLTAENADSRVCWTGS